MGLKYLIIYSIAIKLFALPSCFPEELPKGPPYTVFDYTTNITESSVEVNEQITPDIGELLSASDSTKVTPLYSTVVPFVYRIGNYYLTNVCSIAEDEFTKFSLFYSSHCLNVTVTPPHESTELVGNETSTCQNSGDLPEKGSAEKEHMSSFSIFLILCVLAICVLLIVFSLKKQLNYLPESVTCVIVGAVIGLFLKIMYNKNIANWEKAESFSPTVFFLIILPPIIFESGYNLHKGNFFHNIGSILSFAIAGTVISALVIGGGIFLLGQADVVYKLTFVESFAFGSLISAVDPVATLALFNALNVDQVLYTLVFGESILNDAVAIVLVSTALELSGSTAGDVGAADGLLYILWRFWVMFVASAGIGVVFAVLSALTLKYVPLREYTSLELCIMLIFIYAPYALAEGLQLSGIMAILFNGIVMSQYTHYNLSPIMQITIQHLMRTLSFIAECTVFIYLGMAIFSFRHQFHPALIIWCIVLCLLGRLLNIFPLSILINKFRDHKINSKQMFIMWFSGLRGAIAYALALHLEFSDEKRHVIVTTTLVIVLFTLFVLGGATIPLIRFLEADKKDWKAKNKSKELTLSKTWEWGQAVDSEHFSELTEEEADHIHVDRRKGFLKMDALYIRPFLVRKVTKQEARSHASDLKNQCYQTINLQESESEEELFTGH